MFIRINNYPSKTIENIVQNELQIENVNITNEPQINTTDNNETKLQLFLPFLGKQGIQLLSKIKKQLNKSIPSNMKICITYKRSKLSTQLPVKDRTKFEHRNNIVYFSRFPNVTCNEIYVGKTERRFNKHIIDYNRRGKSSHILQHARQSQYSHVWKDDFKILNGNYKSSIKRNISEAIYIRTSSSLF